jgi:hypothetical protein
VSRDKYQDKREDSYAKIENDVWHYREVERNCE